MKEERYIDEAESYARYVSRSLYGIHTYGLSFADEEKVMKMVEESCIKGLSELLKKTYDRGKRAGSKKKAKALRQQYERGKADAKEATSQAKLVREEIIILGW